MTLYQQQERQAEQNNNPSITDILAKQTREMVSDQKRLSEKINGVTGLDLTPDEYSMISTAMASSKNPDETANRFAQALTYSHNSGITFEEAYSNLDALNLNQLGRKVDVTQTGTKAVINSFKIGKLTVKRQRIAQEAYRAYQNGMDVSSILSSDVAKEIEALDNEIADLQDYMPRAWYTEIAKNAANTLSYSFNVAAAAAAGKALGAVAGSNPVSAGLATLFSFLEGYQLTKYGNWYDNIKAGVDPKVADAVQTVSAGIQAAIESYLDVNVGLVKSLGSGTAKSIASNTLKNMYVNGTLNKVGMFFTKYAINMASEGTEEFLQEITEEVFDNMAFSLSGKEAPNELKDILANSIKAFAGGASSAIILGIGDAAYETKMNVKYAQDLKKEAIANPSKETFINNHIDDEELGTASRKDKSEILSKAYDNTRKAAQEEGVSVSEAKTIDTDYDINDDFNPETDSDEARTSEQPVEPVKRMDNGRLRVQESQRVTQNSDGTESHTLNIGSRGSSTRYGYVDYTIDTQNKTVTIDQVATRLGYEDLARDAVMEVERSHEGWNIEWNPETAAQQAIKEQIVNDPNNPNRGNLQWFNEGEDVDTNIQVGEWIKKTFSNLTTEQSVVAAKLLEFTAKSQGVDTRTWINDHIQNLQSFDESGKKGAVSFNDSDIKAIIYAGENADFSTFSHETFHVLVRTSQAASKLADAFRNASQSADFARYVNSHKQIIKMDLDEVLEAVKDMGDNPLEWTRAQHEVAATFFESYLRDGKTFSEKLKNIFTQIADWFHRIYKALRGENSLNDEIVKAYDEILAGNPELKKTVEASDSVTTQQNGAESEDFSAEDEDEDNGLDEYGNPLYQSENKTEPETLTFNGKSFSELSPEAQNRIRRLLPLAKITFTTNENGESIILAGNSEAMKIALEFVKNENITNKDSGNTGIITGTTQNEIASNKSSYKSLLNGFDNYCHFTAGANLKMLFERAVLTESRNDRNNDRNIKAIHIYSAAVDFGEGDLGAVQILAKEVNNKDHLYSLEIAEIKKLSPKGWDEVDIIKLLPADSFGGAELAPLSNDNYSAKSSAVKTDTLYQSAWHGSPADFEEFDTAHIGEGEGNQSFGWGIYVTNSKTIAKEYAERLAKKWVYFNGKRVNPALDLDNHLSYVAYIFQGNDYSLPRTKADLKSRIASANRLLKQFKDDPAFIAEVKKNKQFFTEVLALLNDHIDSFKVRPERNLYNVDLPDDNGSNYIYWDKEYKPSEFRKVIEAARKMMPLEEQKYFISDYGFDSDYITGQNLYNTLSLAFGRDDKKTSLFLRDQGFVGINYPAGTLSNRPSKARNYVIFNGEDIGITNHVLYQLDNMTESSLIAEAKDFQTKDEFIGFEKAFDLDGISSEELSEIWDKAHGVYQVKKEEYTSPIDPNMPEEDKDEAFRVIMSTDEGIKAFIQRLRDAFSARRDVRRSGGQIGVYTEEDYNAIMQDIANADRVETEAAPYITALAKSNKDITPEAISKVRGMINNSLRDYRDLYSQIIGDENFAAGVYNEFLPNIKDSRANGMRITQRKDLANRIEGELLREEIRRGTEKYDGTAEKVMAVYDKELKDLQDDYAKLKEQYDKTYLKMSVEQQSAVKKAQQIKKMESAIARERQNVRMKLDSGRRVSTEQLQKLNGWEEELNLLHEEIKELRKQDAVKATIERHEALDKLREAIRQKQRDKAAVEAVHRYKRELYNSIVEKIPNNVDWSYVQKINEVIATIKGIQGYQNNSIMIDGKRMKLEDFRKGVEDGSIKIEGLSDYQLKRYLNTSLADLTISDLETLKDTVDYYKMMGKQMWQAKVDQRNFEAEMFRNQILSQVYKSNSYDPEKDHLAGSAESDTVKKKGLLKGGFYKTLNWNRKAQIIDNDSKGLNYDLTVEERRQHQDEMLRGIRDRVNPVKAILEETGLKEQDFYKTIPVVFPDGKVENFTIGRLAYGMLADKNERNLYAVSYGNLVTQAEKEAMTGTQDQANDQIKKLGNARYQAFKAQAEEFFNEHPEYMKVIDAIVADWNSEENLARIQKILIDEYNKPMEVEGFYMTMHRQDFDGTESAYRLQDDMYNLNAGKSKTTPDKGFTESRIDISPMNQQPVDMDIYRVWLQSVEDQENVIANLPYIRKLNRIYKNHGSKGLRSAIENAHGSAILTDLDNYINEVANSALFSDTQEINGIIGKLRGGLYTAYLGYKMSGIVLQGITSPMPSLQEVNPAALAKGLLQMTFHPVSTWKKVCELSPYMEHRSMNPAIEAIRKYASQYTDSKMKTAYKQFLEFGTEGLEMIDRWAVAGSWLAVYEKKLKELGDSAEGIKAAAHYADNFIRDTQPTGDVTELAPLFKSKNAFAQAFTQFQVSLNVIWNNITYDLPKAVKHHEFAKAAGIVFGYALAGMLLNLVQDGFDEDDEPEDIAKQLAYAATTQFTQSVPLLGSITDGISKSLITGESGFVYNTNQLYPGISNITTGLNQMLTSKKGITPSAIKNVTKGIAIMTGLPTSGASEIWQTFFDRSLVDAINEGDLNFTFNPGALLGRRDY